jgi:alkylation response protein AidB-like acyl-CoA dehydrogenase
LPSCRRAAAIRRRIKKARYAITLAQTRPWIASQAERPSEDQYVLAQYGNSWLELEGARLLVDRAMQTLDAAWDRGLELTEAERGETAIAVAASKVAVARGAGCGESYVRSDGRAIDHGGFKAGPVLAQCARAYAA